MQKPLVILALSFIALGRCPSVQAHDTAARLLFFNVKPGARAPFEEAIKQQMAARREGQTSWRWLTWEYMSGEVPRYCVGSFGHEWADFDAPAESTQLEEGRLAAAAALSGQAPVVQYFEHLEEVSHFGATTNAPKMAEISVYQLHYGKTAPFYAALREFEEALSQTGSAQRFEWFELRSGGDTPQFMLLVPRQNWAAFDIDSAQFLERVENAIGKNRARHAFEQFTSAVKSHQRSAVRLRLDLSLLDEGN